MAFWARLHDLRELVVAKALDAGGEQEGEE